MPCRICAASRTQTGTLVGLSITTSHLRFFERVELAVAIADQLLDAFRQFARMRFAAIENRHLVSALERITNLKRSGKTGAAEDQNLQRLGRFFGKQVVWC